MENIFTVIFPDIGEGVVEGEVIEWRKKVGDLLAQDEPVVVVMTDKATVELPAPHPGKLAKQYFAPGEMAIRDHPLYDIALFEEDALISQATPKLNHGTESSAKQDLPPTSAFSKISAGIDLAKDSTLTNTKNLATPKVRALAKELGIPIAGIQGSGKGGRVTPRDLCQKTGHAETAITSLCHLQGDEEMPIIGIKARMVKKMTESNQLIPSFSYFEEVEATRLIQLKNTLKIKAANEGVHLTYMPFILRAISLCITKYPILNSSYDKEQSKLILHRCQNIGIAVATPLGLIVPVLKGIEKLSIEPLIRSYEELIVRAQSGKLQAKDMKEATFTVSNFGSNGSHGLWATPVINYPEAAILAIGKIHPQAVVRDGTVVVREILNLSWSFDHRIIDGEAAAHISQYFGSLLQNPASLL